MFCQNLLFTFNEGRRLADWREKWRILTVLNCYIHKLPILICFQDVRIKLKTASFVLIYFMLPYFFLENVFNLFIKKTIKRYEIMQKLNAYVTITCL